MPVSHVDEVLARALAEPMQPIEWTDADEHAAEPPVPPPWRRRAPRFVTRALDSGSRSLALRCDAPRARVSRRPAGEREHEQAGTHRPCRRSRRA